MHPWHGWRRYAAYRCSRLSLPMKRLGCATRGRAGHAEARRSAAASSPNNVIGRDEIHDQPRQFDALYHCSEVRYLRSVPSLSARLKDRADALFVQTDPLTKYQQGWSDQCPSRLWMRGCLQALVFVRFAEAGGLVSYGPSFIDLFRRGHVDEILRGTEAGQAAREQPTSSSWCQSPDGNSAGSGRSRSSPAPTR